VKIHPVYPQVASTADDGQIRLWDLDSGDHEKTMKGHIGVINYISFSPNAPILASCSADMTIKLWNL
jgi:platelet-activating factor acetylhydrolase IB subunit alpha